jgi:hypothetical protein
MKKAWKRKLRYFYLRFIRLRGTPTQISRGFAIGVFWGMFPLPGIQMATAIVTAACLRSSKIAAVAGTWLTNPITTLPFVAINFHVGQTLLGQQWSDFPVDQIQSFEGWLQLGGDVVIAYLLGCAVTGALGGVVSYLVGLPVVTYLQRRSKRRRRKQHTGLYDRI